VSFCPALGGGIGAELLLPALGNGSGGGAGAVFSLSGLINGSLTSPFVLSRFVFTSTFCLGSAFTSVSKV
jgi:hypothetical protein